MFLLDNTTSTSARVLSRVCTTGQGWKQATTPVIPGHSYTLQLEARDDGATGTPTNAVHDDVAVD